MASGREAELIEVHASEQVIGVEDRTNRSAAKDSCSQALDSAESGGDSEGTATT
jgi:hypothetical protein